MASGAIGHKVWVIPGGHIPETGAGREPDFTSRDELCVLNAGDGTARLEIMLYYEDREPVGPYAAVVRSDAPVVVQFTRVDTRQAALAIATTMALPVDR
jgi:hypothetical protein